MIILRNLTVWLGPRNVAVNGKVIGKLDNIRVDIEEATAEELAELKRAPVILLVKPLPENFYKEVKHEN
jgi:hypothetical protein